MLLFAISIVEDFLKNSVKQALALYPFVDLIIKSFTLCLSTYQNNSHCEKLKHGLLFKIFCNL